MKPVRSMVISLIGRPNVGKSSLFNRMMKNQSKALTYDRPGVTRDRHYGIARLEERADIDSKDVILVDTGGFYPKGIDENDPSQKKREANRFFNIMGKHAELAIEESDLVLFVVDVREGALPFDQTIAEFIRAKRKPFWLLVNKYDSDKQAGEEAEFYSLGINPDQLFTVSAAHGLGFSTFAGALQEEVIAFENSLREADDKMAQIQLQRGVTPREEVVAKVALIGAPNAGKSTLLNKLVGAERALVSEIAGTTIDPIEGFFDLFFGPEVDVLDQRDNFKLDRLVEQYAAFRKNNEQMFQRMVESYVFEEGAMILNDTDDLSADDFEVYQGDFEEGEDGDDDGDFEAVEYSADDSEDFDDSDDSEDYEDEETTVIEMSEQSFDEQYQSLFGDDLDEGDADVDTSENVEVVEEEVSAGSYWRSLLLVDTAGIRKQKSIKDVIEEQSVYRSLRSISEADIIIYMVDATKGLGHQDRRLLDIALEKGKSVIVTLNKFDLLTSKLKDEKAKREWLLDIRDSVPWLGFCDLVPISAKYGKYLTQLKKALKKTVLVRNSALPTGELNRVLFTLVEKNPVVVKRSGGRRLRLKYSSMIKSDPPTVLLFSNRSKGIPENYKRYLKNGLRQSFCLDNTPIHLIFRTGTDLENRVRQMGRDN